MTIRRDQVRMPRLPQEEVDMPSLGGTVIARGLPLSYVLNVLAVDGTSFEDKIFEVLEMSVVLDDDAPLYNQAEWDVFASGRKDEVKRLLDTIRRLTGMDKEENEKNSGGQP